MISSNTLDPTNLESVIDAGVDEVLAKLATPDEIVDAIRRIGLGAAMPFDTALTPLSTQYAETPNNREQRNPLR
jgi:DNA-binding NarL/FixJ family response regulator